MIEHEWKVSVRIDGPVAFESILDIDGVDLRGISNAIEATFTVLAPNQKEAEDAAIRRVSDVLDIVSFVSDQHLQTKGGMSLQGLGEGSASLPASFTINRVLSLNDQTLIKNLYSVVGNMQTADYARALSYYRKGLGSLDPFDSFVSFWQSMEILVGMFDGDSVTSKARNMYRLLGQELPDKFIEYRQMRNNIVHGSKPRSIEQIRLVSAEISNIKHMARSMLMDIQNSNESLSIVSSNRP